MQVMIVGEEQSKKRGVSRGLAYFGMYLKGDATCPVLRTLARARKQAASERGDSTGGATWGGVPGEVPLALV